MRRIFIGDVQGCRQELEALLEKLRYVPFKDELCFVGDLIRRGPESLATLRLVQSLDARFVLGNHEAHLLHCGFFGLPAPSASDWPSLGDLCSLDPAERLAWGDYLGRAPLLLHWPDILVVHAALPPALWVSDLEPDVLDSWAAHRWRDGTKTEEETWFVLTTRYCDAAGQRSPEDWPPPEAPYRPWDSFYRGECTVVFGHWARRGLVRRPRVLGLDTGCVYGGQLTAWIAEEDRLVQVPARKAWIPT